MERDLTPGLLEWAQSLAGPVVRCHDVSWSHGNSDVTRLDLASGEAAYVKRYRARGKFEQERRAYVEWCPRLSHCAPFLGAIEAPAMAIAVGAVPGSPLLGRSGRGPRSLPVEDQRHAYRRAGLFLANLHGLDAEDDDPAPIPEAWRLRARTWAARAGAILPPEDVQGVRGLVEAPWPEGTPVPKRVPCHRDFTERNWLVEGDDFTVIDFEHARMDWSLVDVERALSAIPKGGDGLGQAFLEGYGWGDSLQDGNLLRRVTAVAAFSQVVWAVEQGDGAFERAGRDRLRRCLDADSESRRLR